jgi:hypothetical protein
MEKPKVKPELNKKKLEILLGCGVWRQFEGEKGDRAKI